MNGDPLAAGSALADGRRSVLGTVSLLAGVFSELAFWLPLAFGLYRDEEHNTLLEEPFESIFLAGLAFAVVACVVGIVALKQRERARPAVAGIIAGLPGCLTCLLITYVIVFGPL